MRRGLTILGVVAGLALAGVPALAAEDATITASDFQFSPSEVTIDAGDTVIFANAGGVHNFSFDDGPTFPPSPTGADEPAWDEPPSRTFDAPGQYTFHCQAHGQMQGTITVLEAGPTPDPTTDPTPDPTPDPPPDPPPDPSPEPSPDPSPDPGPYPSPDPSPDADPAPASTSGATPVPSQAGGSSQAAGAAVAVRTLRVARSKFCVKRSRRCRRPGVRLRIDLSQAARVTGELSRRTSRGRWRRVGRLNLGMVEPGIRTLRFRRAGGRRLKPGRYVLVVRVDGGQPRALRFRVRR